MKRGFFSFDFFVLSFSTIYSPRLSRQERVRRSLRERYMTANIPFLMEGEGNALLV